MNHVQELCMAEVECQRRQIEPFRAKDFHQCTARFTRNGSLEVRNASGDLMIFTYDQAGEFARWLAEALKERLEE